ncbi:MAG: phosphate transport system regulatory protein PhoU [Nitrospiraceae bacterium]|nr:MAG: phosphate transport system regulatory protein PhoU [Nitrospiraceae bacterium]
MSPTRRLFDNELTELQNSILNLGNLVQQAIDSAIKALANQDADLAQRVMDGDDLIDKMALDIEDKCIRLIVTQQPIAKDLRKIGTGIRIGVDLERMGDHAYNIAKIALKLSEEKLIKPLIDIPKMADLTQEMVNNVLLAYVHGNPQAAVDVCKADDQIDHLYKMVFDELLEIMIKQPKTIQQATSLLFVCRFLERIADHATNIGEAVIYLETGERKKLNI